MYSGAGGSLLWRPDSPAPGARYGRDLDAAGDWNRDGYDDVRIASHRFDPWLRIHSGRDESLLLEMSDPNGNPINRCACVGDTDLDGVPACLTGRSGAWLFSGASSALLQSLAPKPLAGDLLGCALDGAGDLDGNGSADFLMGDLGARSGGVQSGAACSFTFRSFLETSAATLSVSSGAGVRADIDLPWSEAVKFHALLCSRSGAGTAVRLAAVSCEKAGGIGGMAAAARALALPP